MSRLPLAELVAAGCDWSVGEGGRAPGGRRGSSVGRERSREGAGKVRGRAGGRAVRDNPGAGWQGTNR